MKTLYKTPEITVEELTKADVLCASAFDTDNNLGSYSGAGGVGSAGSFDFDTGRLLTP